jgi:hypothetical protein
VVSWVDLDLGRDRGLD